MSGRIISRLQRFYKADTPLRWRRLPQGLIDEMLYWMPIIEREEMLIQAEAIILASKGEEAVQEERQLLRKKIENRVPHSSRQVDMQPEKEEEPFFKSFEELEIYAHSIFGGIE